MKLTELYNIRWKRRYHTANKIGNSIFLFGGETRTYYVNNQMRVYDIAKGTLKKVRPVLGDIPPRRTHHGSAVIGNQLFIYGGYSWP